MKDIHSHILPCVDDGSSSIDESISLIKMLREQGIDDVSATPHYIANRDSLSDFLSKRSEAFDKIKAEASEYISKIRLGAEVAYYPGISRLDGLCDLLIEGSNLLLLEMPVSVWSDYMVQEIINMSSSGSFVLVIAHAERYIDLQRKNIKNLIYSSDILIQSNAAFFINLSTRRKALKLLNDGYINFLGSDCHNTKTRPPKIGEAYSLIENKLGNPFLKKINDFSKVFIK